MGKRRTIIFDAHILSFRLQKVKPEKEIYEAAIRQARATKKECFYIDDIPEYVATARTLGIEGHVYHSFPLFIASLKAEHIF